MTQKALATLMNEKPQVIAEYESGKAIPNPQLIAKIERALGTRLPRPKKAAKKPTVRYYASIYTIPHNHIASSSNTMFHTQLLYPKRCFAAVTVDYLLQLFRELHQFPP
jgi:transcriptional regulator with XRE-family HTH domain